MKGAHSISTRRAYGVQRVCRVWHRARSSVYARRQATTSPCRRGPVGAAPDDVLVGHIGRMLEASPFHGEGYRKAWAKLRVEGIRTSQERVRRLMREHDLQAPHRVGHAHGPKAHDGTITTEAPDVMWGTDMTTTVTVSEGAAFVFVAVDHCTTECIGLHAAKRGTRFEALEPIRQGVRERFGEIGDGVARGLRLRHDHGSNQRREDAEYEAAGRRGDVDLRALPGEHPQAHAADRQVLHGVDQVGEVAAEAVELPDDEHVALPQGAHAAVESGRSSRTPDATSW